MQVVNSLEYLSNRLRSILLREFTLFADAIEQFTASRQLRYDVVFVLL